MKKIKDFLYDKSDLLIALAILLIAAALIAWRLDVIMDYPKEIVKDNDHQTEFPVSPPENNEEGSSEEQTPQGGSNEESEGNSETPEVEDPVDKPEPQKPLWEGGVLTREVTVTVKGNSATAAVQCLIDAGLFEDYKEYADLCASQGVAHPESVIAGTFTFEEGTSKATVLSRVNWS